MCPCGFVLWQKYAKGFCSQLSWGKIDHIKSVIWNSKSVWSRPTGKVQPLILGLLFQCWPSALASSCWLLVSGNVPSLQQSRCVDKRDEGGRWLWDRLKVVLPHWCLSSGFKTQHSFHLCNSLAFTSSLFVSLSFSVPLNFVPIHDLGELCGPPIFNVPHKDIYKNALLPFTIHTAALSLFLTHIYTSQHWVALHTLCSWSVRLMVLDEYEREEKDCFNYFFQACLWGIIVEIPAMMLGVAAHDSYSYDCLVFPS